MNIFTNGTNQPGAQLPIAKEYEESKAYIYLLRDSKEVLTEILGSKELAETLVTKGFWAVKISSFNETHTQASSIVDVKADTYVAFSTGTLPISVSISGWVAKATSADHRLDLLYVYMECLRGTASTTKIKVPIYLKVRDTIMCIFAHSLNIQNSSEKQDMDLITLEGVASQYDISSGYISTSSEDYAWLGEEGGFGII